MIKIPEGLSHQNYHRSEAGDLCPKLQSSGTAYVPGSMRRAKLVAGCAQFQRAALPAVAVLQGTLAEHGRGLW